MSNESIIKLSQDPMVLKDPKLQTEVRNYLEPLIQAMIDQAVKQKTEELENKIKELERQNKVLADYLEIDPKTQCVGLDEKWNSLSYPEKCRRERLGERERESINPLWTGIKSFIGMVNTRFEDLDTRLEQIGKPEEVPAMIDGVHRIRAELLAKKLLTIPPLDSRGNFIWKTRDIKAFFLSDEVPEKYHIKKEDRTTVGLILDALIEMYEGFEIGPKKTKRPEGSGKKHGMNKERYVEVFKNQVRRK